MAEIQRSRCAGVLIDGAGCTADLLPVRRAVVLARNIEGLVAALIDVGRAGLAAHLDPTGVVGVVLGVDVKGLSGSGIIDEAVDRSPVNLDEFTKAHGLYVFSALRRGLIVRDAVTIIQMYRITRDQGYRIRGTGQRGIVAGDIVSLGNTDPVSCLKIGCRIQRRIAGIGGDARHIADARRIGDIGGNIVGDRVAGKTHADGHGHPRGPETCRDGSTF